MNNQLYATLRERIVKVVPEIMELKFGCRIENHSDVYPEVTFEGGIIVSTRSDANWAYFTLDNGEEVCLEDIFAGGTIVGRDIQLADVLRAIPKNAFIRINADGYIYDSYEDDKGQEWNLALPLHEQSDELGEWLMEVIR